MAKKIKFNLEKFADTYKKAKPLKVTELYILGMLAYKDSSGYDIYRLIAKKSEGVGAWLKLNKATIYNTLARMTQDRLIEVSQIVQDIKRPTKSIYRLRPKGREYLRNMLLEDLHGPPWVFVNFTLPLRFSKVLSKKELKEIVQQKIEQVELFLQFNKMTYGEFFSGTILELMQENQIRIFEVQLEFLNKLQKELDKKSVNELFKIDEFDIDKIMAKVKKLTRKVE